MQRKKWTDSKVLNCQSRIVLQLVCAAHAENSAQSLCSYFCNDAFATTQKKGSIRGSRSAGEHWLLQSGCNIITLYITDSVRERECTRGVDLFSLPSVLGGVRLVLTVSLPAPPARRPQTVRPQRDSAWWQPVSRVPPHTHFVRFQVDQKAGRSSAALSLLKSHVCNIIKHGMQSRLAICWSLSFLKF